MEVKETIEEEMRATATPDDLRLAEDVLKKLVCDPTVDPRVRNRAIDCMCAIAHHNGIRKAFPEFTRVPNRKISTLLEEIFTQKPRHPSDN